MPTSTTVKSPSLSPIQFSIEKPSTFPQMTLFQKRELVVCYNNWVELSFHSLNFLWEPIFPPRPWPNVGCLPDPDLTLKRKKGIGKRTFASSFFFWFFHLLTFSFSSSVFLLFLVSFSFSFFFFFFFILFHSRRLESASSSVVFLLVLVLWRNRKWK